MDRIKSTAENFMRHHVLVVNSKKFRIIECEGYLYSPEHPDLFVHKNEMQKSFNMFYFHRASKSATGKYKSGTFKGVDITFSEHPGEYAGLLIRSICLINDAGESINGEDFPLANKKIEGSCNVVDRILKELNADKIDDIVRHDDIDSPVLNIFDHAGGIWIEEDFQISRSENLPQSSIENRFQSSTENDSRLIIQSPRVGLTYKSKDPDQADKFIFKKYRFGFADSLPSNSWGFCLADKRFVNGEKSKIYKAKKYQNYLAWYNSALADAEKNKEIDHRTMIIQSIQSRCQQYAVYKFHKKMEKNEN